MAKVTAGGKTFKAGTTLQQRLAKERRKKNRKATIKKVLKTFSKKK
jgi:hypothetical protein